MLCDPVCQVSSDLIGPLGTPRFFSTHQYPGILFREIKLLSNWSRTCGKNDYAWKCKHKATGQAIRLCRGLVQSLYQEITAGDVVNIAARSNEFTLILWSLFPQFLRNMIASFKMLKFPSNCGYFWKWVGWNDTQILKPSGYEENEKSINLCLKGYSNLKNILNFLQAFRPLKNSYQHVKNSWIFLRILEYS